VAVHRRSSGTLIEVSNPGTVPICGDVLAPNADLTVDGAVIARSVKMKAGAGNASNIYYLKGQDMTVSTEAEPVYSVALQITAPVAGAKPDYSPVLPSTVYRDITCEGQAVKGVVWYDVTTGDTVNKTNGVFLEGHRYKATILLYAEAGYEFTNATEATVNGKAASETSLDSYGLLQVSCQFQKPVITVQPKAATVALNGTAKFSVTATGTGLTYQWQYSADGGTTWKKPSFTSNTATITMTATSARNGLLFRCLVTNSYGTTTSSTAKLTVTTKPVITVQPKAVTAALNGTAKFSVTAVGPGLSYQWQYSADGGTTWKTPSFTSNTASITMTATSARNGLLFRDRKSVV
jgi:hypothetical protein